MTKKKEEHLSIRGAIFDVDGTLLDSMPVWKNLGERYLAGFGIKAEPGLTEVLNTMSTRQGASYLIDQYRLGINVKDAMEGISSLLYEFYSQKAPLKSGVKECLKVLDSKGIPMVIATSSEKENVEAALKRYDILKYFQKILTCSDLGTDKTRPDIFLAAAKLMGIKPQETLVFEDASYAIQTVKNAGFVTIAVHDRSNEGQEKEIRKIADYYLQTLEEFKFQG